MGNRTITPVDQWPFRFGGYVLGDKHDGGTGFVAGVILVLVLFCRFSKTQNPVGIGFRIVQSNLSCDWRQSRADQCQTTVCEIGSASSLNGAEKTIYFLAIGL